MPDKTKRESGYGFKKLFSEFNEDTREIIETGIQRGFLGDYDEAIEYFDGS
ncbi:MAG: hypothetical protein ACREA7_03795 [Nitrosotalea sp.]